MIGLSICESHGELRLEICDCGETDLKRMEMRDGWVICSTCGDKTLIRYLLPSNHIVEAEKVV